MPCDIVKMCVGEMLNGVLKWSFGVCIGGEGGKQSGRLRQTEVIFTYVIWFI